MSRVGVVFYRQEVEKKSCIPFLVKLGWVWSGNFGDRDDRVDRIGSGNPPLTSLLLSGDSNGPLLLYAIDKFIVMICRTEQPLMIV